jgi:hypothetical protein
LASDEEFPENISAAQKRVSQAVTTSMLALDEAMLSIVL